MSRDAQYLLEKPMVRRQCKKKRPGKMQKLGRNSEGDFPLKPYPVQRFQG